MKKSSLIIVLLFGILSLVYSQSITFQMPEITNPADTIAVPLSVVQCNLGCCEIGTFQIIVEYDPAVLSPISVLFPNSNFPFYEWMINMVYVPNKIAITWLSFTGSGNIQPPEVVCEVLFAYFGGCSDLLLSGGGGNCTYIFENGSVGCNTSIDSYITKTLNDINIWGQNDKIIVQSEEPVIGDIFIYNLIGQKIHTESIQSSYKEISINQSHSVYLVKIVTPDTAFVKTIVNK